FFRRHLVGPAGPDCAQFPCGLLRGAVARSRKYEKVASFVKRNLRDQVRGVAKAIDTEPPRVPRFTIGTITDQSRAKQRRDLDVAVAVRQVKTVSRIGDGEFGVTAVDGVASETRTVTEILPARSAISAVTICPTE